LSACEIRDCRLRTGKHVPGFRELNPGYRSMPVPLARSRSFVLAAKPDAAVHKRKRLRGRWIHLSRPPRLSRHCALLIEVAGIASATTLGGDQDGGPHEFHSSIIVVSARSRFSR